MIPFVESIDFVHLGRVSGTGFRRQKPHGVGPKDLWYLEVRLRGSERQTCELSQRLASILRWPAWTSIVASMPFAKRSGTGLSKHHLVERM